MGLLQDLKLVFWARNARGTLKWAPCHPPGIGTRFLCHSGRLSDFLVTVELTDFAKIGVVESALMEIHKHQYDFGCVLIWGIV